MGLDVFVPGEGDLSLGLERFQELTKGWTVLAGNLSCGELSWPGTTVIEREGRRIGFIGVVDHAPAGCVATDPLDAVRAGVLEVGAVDALVLIAHTDSGTSREAAEQVPELDFVLNGHTRQRHAAPFALPNGAFQLGAGSRGKVLGFLELEFEPGASGWTSDAAIDQLEDELKRHQERQESAQTKLAEAVEEPERGRQQRQVDYYAEKIAETETELVALKAAAGGASNHFENLLRELDDGVADHPGTKALLDITLASIEGLAPQEAAPPVTAFVGSASCRGCHAEAYAHWEATPHAGAWQTLVTAKRAADQDCFSCHATGADDPKGPQSPSGVTPVLQGVGCESCHGEGEQHINTPVESPMTLPSLETCTGCHDGVRDEGEFVYEDYLPRVAH